MSRKKVILYLFTAAIALFLIVFIPWWRWANTLPAVEPLQVQMPSPNAFDFYLEAGKAIVPPKTAIDPITDDASIPRSQWKTHYPIAHKEAWQRQNARALQLLREGLKYECRIPLKEPTDTLTVSKSLRWVMRMLVIESHVHSERGDYGKARQPTAW